MHQYSGPGSQQVVDNWGVGSMGSGAMFDYYLTQKGYIVVTVDGRGTGARGAEFEKCTYLKLGAWNQRISRSCIVVGQAKLCRCFAYWNMGLELWRLQYIDEYERGTQCVQGRCSYCSTNELALL